MPNEIIAEMEGLSTPEATPETQDPLGGFPSIGTQVDSLPDPVTVDSDIDPVDTPAVTEDVATSEEQADGPSPVMQAIARSMDVPDELLSQAKDDSEVQQYINLVQTFQSKKSEDPKPAEEVATQVGEPVDTTEAEALFELTLPDEDFGPDDPIRQQFTGLVETLNKRAAEDRRVLSALMGFANDSMMQQKTAQETEFANSVQKPFDTTLDAYKNDLLGDSTKQLSTAQIKVREKVFGPYKTMLETLPDGDKSVFIRQIVSHMLPGVKTPTNKAKAIRRQRQKMLGTSAPSDPQPGLEEFQSFLDGRMA